jgi:hypothetical protein
MAYIMQQQHCADSFPARTAVKLLVMCRIVADVSIYTLEDVNERNFVEPGATTCVTSRPQNRLPGEEISGI